MFTRYPYINKHWLPVARTIDFKTALLVYKSLHGEAPKHILGVIVDEKCSWKEYIDYVSKKMSKSVGIIRKVHKYLNRSGLFTLYYSLVYPYLSYCNIAWACTFPTYLHKLHLIQKRFIRIATSSESTATSAPLFSKSKILSIYNINTMETCIFVFKVQYQGHTLPSHFQQYFQNNSNIHSRTTRQSKLLHIPLCCTTRAQFSIKYKGVTSWNKYIHLTNSSPSLPIYKRKLKDHLHSMGLS